MKDNLIMKQYDEEVKNGLYNLLEEETFFSSKIMELEDKIIINDLGIQYYEYQFDAEPNDLTGQTQSKMNGYQYNELNIFTETFNLLDLVEIKDKYHSIELSQQSSYDKAHNTKWIITINIKEIIIDYLFAKIKERRTFKSLNYNNFLNQNINESIRKYIELNLLDRYNFEKIDFYVKYTNINKNSIYNIGTLKQFEPLFLQEIESDENQVKNVITKTDDFLKLFEDIKISYSQVESSKEYKFDYYFNLHFNKI
jgi:hypothetical protein